MTLVAAILLILGAGLAPSPSAAAALAQVARASGVAYGGDCADATPRNYGQYCSRDVADHPDGVHAYLVGPVFSEFTTWVFVQQTANDEWVALGAAPYDETNTIPWP